MRVTALILPFGIVAASMAIFRGPPAEVQFSQETTRTDADSVELEATQQWTRAAEASSLANGTLRSATGVILSCLSALLEVTVTEMISCPNPHDQHNCARARTAKAKGIPACADQIAKYTTAATGFNQLNKMIGRQLGAQLHDSASNKLSAEGSELVGRVDPVTEGPLFPASTTQQACKQATDLAKTWPMIKAPFLADVQSRVPGFADAVIAQVAARGCGLASVPRPRLRQIPKLDEEARRDCHGLEQQMLCQVAYAEGAVDGCASASELRDGGFARGQSQDEEGGGQRSAGRMEPRPLVLSSDVARYASCTALGATGAAALRSFARGAASPPARWRCSFDMESCNNDKVESRSEEFLTKHLPSRAFAASGTGTTGAQRASQRSCTTVKRPVNAATQRIFGGLRRFASFNRASDSALLDEPHVSTSCAQWYSRDGERGACEGVPVDEQAFHPECWTGFAPVRGM